VQAYFKELQRPISESKFEKSLVRSHCLGCMGCMQSIRTVAYVPINKDVKHRMNTTGFQFYYTTDKHAGNSEPSKKRGDY
jgi:hypothetical protein